MTHKEFSRRGGKACTKAQNAARRKNGLLGGRPKKPKRIARRRNAKLTDAGTKTP